MNITLRDGISLRYEHIDGSRSKPILIFLHEGLGCVEMWRDFPARLCRATGCAGLVYDRCGYGHSSPLLAPRSSGYLHEAALVELPQLLSALAPGAPHILVGHSDGGSIALIYGSRAAAELLGIVSMAAHVFVEPVTLEGVRAADARFRAEGPGGLARYHGDKAHQIFKAWSSTWLHPGFADWDITSLLPAIRCPVLVLQGADDQYGSPLQVEAIVAGVAGPVESLLLPDCGHAPHLEQPKRVLDLAQPFIAGQCRQ